MRIIMAFALVVLMKMLHSDAAVLWVLYSMGIYLACSTLLVFWGDYKEKTRMTNVTLFSFYLMPAWVLYLFVIAIWLLIGWWVLPIMLVGVILWKQLLPYMFSVYDELL